jgi:hypothetical protein
LDPAGGVREVFSKTPYRLPRSFFGGAVTRAFAQTYLDLLGIGGQCCHPSWKTMGKLGQCSLAEPFKSSDDHGGRQQVVLDAVSSPHETVAAVKE